MSYPTFSPAKMRSAAAASAIALAAVLSVFPPSMAVEAQPVQAGEQRVAPQQLGRWSATAAQALLGEIEAAAGEGLDAEDYQPAMIRASLARQPGGGPELDRLADEMALQLAHDYLLGRVDQKARYDWHIERTDTDRERLKRELSAAVAEGRVQPWLRSLLPSDTRYLALRQAYARVPEANVAMRDRVRANLERWRWMPRDLGRDHIYVNVPSYTLQVVDDGKVVSDHVVVVGARATPTPAIQYPARGIVLNPWWTPPKSIKVSGRGFVNSGGVLRQPPGPRNALGRIKIDLPNPHAIYLHDTPAKANFAAKARAFSHGCIRVQDVERLAEELVRLDGGNAGIVDQGLRTFATRSVPLRQPRPVWLVYFTADVGPDGEVRLLDDPYSRDRRLLASLGGTVQFASR